MGLTKLDEIRKRLEDATPGPWRFVPGQKSMQVYSEADGDNVVYSGEWVAEVGLLADQQLIAHAPSDLALLLRIVERQRECIEQCTIVLNGAFSLGLIPQGDNIAEQCIAEVDKLVGGEDASPE